jgi:hypothetical protein
MKKLNIVVLQVYRQQSKVTFSETYAIANDTKLHIICTKRPAGVHKLHVGSGNVF